MQSVKLKCTIPEDHLVVLEVPPHLPVGEAEVLVSVHEAGDLAEGNAVGILQFLDKHSNSKYKTRTKEDIDRYLAEERATWER